MKIMRTLITITFLLFAMIPAYNQTNTALEQPTKKAGFLENKGQIMDQNGNTAHSVKFLYNGKNMNVQLRKTGFSYDCYVVKNHAVRSALKKSMGVNDSSVYHFHRIDIEFEGCNKSAEIQTSQSTGEYFNYYTSGTGEKGITNVKSYKKVLYLNIYPGIDAEFIVGENGTVKYNFIVHAGADAGKIKLKYIGALNTYLSNNQISLLTAHGEIKERIPRSFVGDKNINVNYVSSTYNTFGFEIKEKYDHSKTLVIDPTPNLIWSTYYGGSGNESASGNGAVRTDSQGNVFICGDTQSPNNMASVGAHQTSMAGVQDIYLVKFNASGVRQWATYYGGTGEEYGYGENLCIDSFDNIYICGYTSSSATIATAGSYDVTMNGTSNSFIAKFNTTGTRLWGTYYGNSQEIGCSIVTDGAGYLYMCGRTFSMTTVTFLATAGTHKTSSAGMDLFVAKFDLNGTTRLWGTYYGGNSDEQKGFLAYDPSGFLYISGGTASSTGLASAGSHQPTHGGGTWDWFLGKLNATNGTGVWATYYGGSSDEAMSFEGCVALDPTGNAYIVGLTQSSNNISTAGSHQTTLSGSYDGFMACFNSSGVRQWGTYFGGPGFEFIGGVCSDPSGMIYITGNTSSTTGIATTGAYQTVYQGGDAFVAKFSPTGTQIWGTYYGGGGSGFSASTSGNSVYALFRTGSSAVTTPGAHQTTIGGSADLFLTKFDGACSAPAQSSSISGNTSVCSGATENYSVTNDPTATSYTWTLPGGWTGTSTTNSINATIGSAGGTISVIANNACGSSSAQTLNVTVNTTPSTPGSISGNTTICSGTSQTYAVTSIAGATSYTWSLPGGWSGTSTTNSINSTAGISGGAVSVTADNACGSSSAQTLTVTVNTVPAQPSSITGNNAVCENSSQNYTVTNDPTATSYTWGLPATWTGSSTSNSVSATAGTSSGQITVTANNNCGSSTAQTLNITVNALPTVTLSLNATSVCVDNAVFAFSGGSPAGGNFSGTGVSGGNFNAATAGVGTHTITYTFTDANSCTNLNTDQITVNNCTNVSDPGTGIPDISIYPNPTTDNITITCSNGNFDVQILNVTGEIIIQCASQNTNAQINLSNLPAGMYYVKIGNIINNIIKK